MEIILTQDVATLGMAGQVLKVSPGYARNYLLPGSYALPATPANLRMLAKKREEFEERSRAEKDNALILKKTLESLTLTVTRKSVEKGKLYGAVTAQDIVDAAAAEDIQLDRRRLKIADPVKSIGEYEIGVRLHPEVTGTFRLRVEAEAEPEPAAEPEPEASGRRRPKSREAQEAQDAPEAQGAAPAEGFPEGYIPTPPSGAVVTSFTDSEPEDSGPEDSESDPSAPDPADAPSS
ncbi:MAG: 50S ribosomal protein L9 [Deltaproteobacteria bacterium]|nr:50S ribosomal protein L9 [Deltaproteobacteria bacterium]